MDLAKRMLLFAIGKMVKGEMRSNSTNSTTSPKSKKMHKFYIVCRNFLDILCLKMLFLSNLRLPEWYTQKLKQLELK